MDNLTEKKILPRKCCRSIVYSSEHGAIKLQQTMAMKLSQMIRNGSERNDQSLQAVRTGPKVPKLEPVPQLEQRFHNIGTAVPLETYVH